jgi:hypothetical protein
MLERRYEKKLLLPSVVSMVEKRIPYIRAMVDKGNVSDTHNETFELFFNLRNGFGDTINPDTADGSEILFDLARGAARLIKERYNDYYKDSLNEIACIGIYQDTLWYFGQQEVPEIEAMTGQKPHPDDIVGCWTFFVRFAPEIDLIDGRCMSAKPKSIEQFMRSRQDDNVFD